MYMRLVLSLIFNTRDAIISWSFSKCSSEFYALYYIDFHAIMCGLIQVKTYNTAMII